MSNIHREITNLIKEMGEEYKDKAGSIIDINKKLGELETRIANLESLLPGNEERN